MQRWYKKERIKQRKKNHNKIRKVKIAKLHKNIDQLQKNRLKFLKLHKKWAEIKLQKVGITVAKLCKKCKITLKKDKKTAAKLK